MTPRQRVTRRRFLRAGLFASGAAAVATACGGSRAGGSGAAKTPMPLRTLGRTGLQVSEIGFGGFPIDDPDVLRYALDRGIRYVDTSNCYRGGKSEETIGIGLQGRRDNVVLTTKWCPHHLGREPKKQAFLDQLDVSLRRLKTDHVDVLLNHEIGKNSDGIGQARLDNPEMLEAWEIVKKAGKARFLGASGHDPDLMAIMNHAVDKGPFDVILCRYSFLDYPEQDKLIGRAHDKGLGFVAMKTLAGAKGADLDRFRDRQVTFKQAALKWVLSNASVSNLIISITSTRQVDEYVAAAGEPLTTADREVLDDYARTFSTQVCRFDGACLPACPEGVRITDILRFSMYYHEYGQQERGVESYAKLVAAERAAHCLHCAGFCEQACSYELPVKTLMLKADRTLTPGGA